ncbi:hypothetical protein [Natrarchaeobius chitinivorans]|nr:hypothetical protein [Natrarchaeobius chitinivorans]
MAGCDVAHVAWWVVICLPWRDAGGLERSGHASEAASITPETVDPPGY